MKNTNKLLVVLLALAMLVSGIAVTTLTTSAVEGTEGLNTKAWHFPADQYGALMGNGIHSTNGDTVKASVAAGTGFTAMDFAAVSGVNAVGNADWYVIKYTGVIVAEESGWYQLSSRKVDNGYIAYVAGEKVFDMAKHASWLDNGRVMYCGEKMYLEAGVAYSYEAYFIEQDGGDALEMKVRLADGSEKSFADAGIKFYADVAADANATVEIDDSIPTLATSPDKELYYNNFEGTPLFMDGDDSVEIGTEILEGRKDVAIEFVIKTVDANRGGLTNHAGFAGIGTNDEKNWVVMGYRDHGAIKFGMRTVDDEIGSGDSGKTADDLFHCGVWYTIKYTFSETTVKAFIDGVELKSWDITGQKTIGEIEGNFVFGKELKWNDPGFKGYVSEIRVTTSEEPADDTPGDDNTGDDNTGDDNTGDDNTGDDNTGDDNTGGDNTGDDNTGDDNTGDDNTEEIVEGLNAQAWDFAADAYKTLFGEGPNGQNGDTVRAAIKAGTGLTARTDCQAIVPVNYVINADWYAIQYTGVMTVAEDGWYQFTTDKVDNGYVAYVGGVKVFDFAAHGAWADLDNESTFGKTVYLEAGVKYSYEAYFVEQDGGQVATLQVVKADGKIYDCDDAGVKFYANETAEDVAPSVWNNVIHTFPGSRGNNGAEVGGDNTVTIPATANGHVWNYSANGYTKNSVIKVAWYITVNSVSDDVDPDAVNIIFDNNFGVEANGAMDIPNSVFTENVGKNIIVVGVFNQPNDWMEARWHINVPGIDFTVNKVVVADAETDFDCAAATMGGYSLVLEEANDEDIEFTASDAIANEDAPSGSVGTGDVASVAALLLAGVAALSGLTLRKKSK